MNEKVSIEGGEELLTTYKIINYYLLKYPIRIIDISGYKNEQDGNIIEIIKRIIDI